MIDPADITAIGKLLRTHALQGELNAMLDIDPGFVTPQTPLILDIDGIYVPFYPESIRPKGATTSLVRLEGVDSEQEARQLVNKTIYARKSDIREYDMLNGDDSGYADDEGDYADDLVGYTVTDTVAGTLGVIGRLDLSTANPLFVVDRPDGSELLLPIAAEFIDAIDHDTHTVAMSLPEGMPGV